MTNSVTTTAAPSAECKLSVGDRETDRRTDGPHHRLKRPLHYVWRCHKKVTSSWL